MTSTMNDRGARNEIKKARGEVYRGAFYRAAENYDRADEDVRNSYIRTLYVCACSC